MFVLNTWYVVIELIFSGFIGLKLHINSIFKQTYDIFDYDFCVSNMFLELILMDSMVLGLLKVINMSFSLYEVEIGNILNCNSKIKGRNLKINLETKIN